MDLRTKRTKQSIINAFIELRAQKPIEKISIKELSEVAFINKATFYLHYKDIYDLSEQLENETIDAILSHFSHPEELITKPKQATKTLADAFLFNDKLIKSLFSDSRSSFFVTRLDEKLKQRIYSAYPEYKNNVEWEILLTYLIQGGFNAFLSHSKDTDINRLIDIVGNITETILCNRF